MKKSSFLQSNTNLKDIKERIVPSFFPALTTSRLTVALCFALVMSFADAMLGQSTDGHITGIVKDPAGSVVEGATVTAIDDLKGTRTVVTTDKAGEYHFSSLLPSAYTVLISKNGFGTVAENSVVVEVDQTVRLDVSLAVGTVEQSVTVNTATSLLDTTSGSLGDVVTGQQIEELPLNIRDPLGLVALTPGAVLGPNFGNGGGPNVGRNFFKSNFNVGGGKSGSQAILIDGAPDTTGDVSRAIIDPPVDAVQEFKVQATSYDAQYGRTSGAIVNILTKSGGNSIHGAAYDFERDSALDATNYFSVGDVPRYHRRQAGGVVGFPILQNRWFGFADFETLREALPESFLDTVPTVAERAGDFSSDTYTTVSTVGGVTTSTTAPVVIYDPATYNAATNRRTQIVGCDGVTRNVICPTRISQLSQNLVNLYPLPNAPGNTNNVNNYVYTANQTTNSNKYDFRSDINLGHSMTAFGRFSRQKDNRLVPGSYPNDAGTLTTDIYTQVVLGFTKVLATNAVANVTTSFSRANAIQVGAGPQVDITTLGFSANFASQATKQIPELATTDVTNLDLLSNVGQQHQPRNTYATFGFITLLHGRNAIKFGGEEWILDFNEYQNAASSGILQFDHTFTQASPSSSSTKTAGADIADLLLGIPSGINAVSGGIGSYIRNVQAISTRGVYYAAFVHDDYRVLDKLTLNMGLRWDVSLGDREKYNRLAWFDPNAPSPLGPSIGNTALKGQVVWTGHGNDKDQQLTSWWNLNPRFGFAYQLPRQIVFRGGYGIFFLPRSVQGSNVGAVSTTVDTVVPTDGPTPTTSLANPFASGVNLPNNDRSPIAGVGSAIEIPTHDFEAAYVQLFSLGFQGQLPWGIVADIHYWANIGTHVSATANINQLPSADLALGSTLATTMVANPFYGVIPGQKSTEVLRQSLLPFPQYSGDTGVLQQLDPVGKTNYNALTVQAQKHFSQSLSFTLQYTFGKAMDNLTTPINTANRAAEYALSTLDVTNQFIGSFLGQIPYGRSRRFGKKSSKLVNGLLGNWNFNGIVQVQSGFPVQISRPSNLAAGAIPHLSNPTPNRWFNTAGITSAAYSYGNIGPNLPGVRTDAIRNFDSVLEKNFQEKWHSHEYILKIRAEAYNTFNHPQFAAPVGTISSAQFGTVQSQLNQPRNFQFGAKVKF